MKVNDKKPQVSILLRKAAKVQYVLQPRSAPHSDPFGRKSSKKSVFVWKYILTLFLPAKKVTLKTIQGQNQPLCA